MPKDKDNLYVHLERIFHEPGRMAIMSNLLGASNGMTFSQLKNACDLTDGNLSRHLKALEKARAVTIKKRFVKNRPQTTVVLSKHGQADFMAYLQALEAVLLDAAAKVNTQKATNAGYISLFNSKLTEA